MEKILEKFWKNLENEKIGKILEKIWKNFGKKFWRPNPPNRGAKTARREVAPIVQMQKAKQ